jgi:ribosomal protein L24E
MKYKVGQFVRSTGFGISSSWGNYIGEIKKVNLEKILVFWNELNKEVEMNPDEIELLTDRSEVKKLSFTDGMVIHVNGEYRLVKFRDGHYLVGHGNLFPVASEKEGTELIEKLKRDPTQVNWVKSRKKNLGKI